MKPPTVFLFRATRLVGVEIELDASSTAPVHTVDVSGWERRGDGSIRRGWEYVMAIPQPYTVARDFIRRFCATATDKKIYAGKRGSTHVHVQAHDLTHWQMYALSKFYWECREFIGRLVPPSRNANSYCPIKDPGRLDAFVQSWNLGHHYANREEACRPPGGMISGFFAQHRYNAVNLSPVRVANPLHRSVEFRQGGASTRFASSYGWTSFCVALVELASKVTANSLIETPTTWSSFVGMIAKFDTRLADWLEWRTDYLYRTPTEEDLAAVIDAMGDGRDYGLFTVSRRADLSLNVGRMALETLVSRGTVARESRAVNVDGLSTAVDKFILKALDQTSTVDRYFAIVSQR